MNLHHSTLNKKLDEAYCETARLRIAIMRAVGRDIYALPPSDEILIAELVRVTTASTRLPAAGSCATNDNEPQPQVTADR